MFYIFDTNAYENLDRNYEECVIETNDLFETMEELLNAYYEVDTVYGDPIVDLMRYIPDSKLPDLLENYNYKVFRTKRAVVNYLEELEKQERRTLILNKIHDRGGLETLVKFYELKKDTGVFGKSGEELAFYTIKDDFMKENDLSGKLRCVNFGSGEDFAPAFQWKPDFDKKFFELENYYELGNYIVSQLEGK